MPSESDIRRFTAVLWEWYARHKRTLPWRDLTDADPNRRAYKVLVSEVMLQQTQVPRVIGAFKVFLERFPLITKLAQSSNANVILAWRGMGYNNRALRLRDAARAIDHAHAGVFPTSMEELQALPGVGHYTAAAVRNFAFGIATPCLDTNIRRVLHRAFFGPERADGTWSVRDDDLLALAARVLAAAEQTLEEARGDIPRCGAAGAEWHAALMDFGSLVCTKRSPAWERCPLTAAGLMKAAGKVPTLVRAPKTEPGRMIAGRFVPNRIIRGRIVDVLRDAPKGLGVHAIGAASCIDWDPAAHRTWLLGLLRALEADAMISKKKASYTLASGDAPA